MIKRILVPLDLSRYAESALETACFLAKAHGAEVEGLVVADSPIAAIVEERRNEVLSKFRRTCKSRDVPHQEALEVGEPSQAVLKEACTFDLIVMGLRTHYNLAAPKAEDESLPRVLSAAGPPVLAVPDDDAIELKNVLIAYDGSRAAAKALREFADLASPLGDLELILVCSNEVAGKAKACARSATAYLKAYEFNRIRTATTDDDPYDFIAEEFLDHVDMVVAGTHAKSAVRDFFVGSFTNDLIGLGRKALLLAH